MLLRVTTGWTENCENNEEVRSLIERFLNEELGVKDDKIILPTDSKVELVSEPTQQEQCQFQNANGLRCHRAAESHIADVNVCPVHRWWGLDRLHKKEANK